MSTLAVIPARYASTRFPGKPLVDIGGKSMLQRVYEQVLKSEQVERCIIATDDDRIFKHARSIGAEVMMTSPNHKTGTDRVWEVVRLNPSFEVVVNVQGDEPFINPKQIDQVILNLKNDASAQISTLAKLIESEGDLFNSTVVKLTFDKYGRALYFSRSTIPHLRNVETSEWLKEGVFYKHIGLYGFKTKVLEQISQLEQSQLEKLESLEQLRWLEEGYFIKVRVTEYEAIGIDTPEDLEKAKAYLNNI